MIKAQELRIGNLVYNGFNEVITAQSVTELSIGGYNIETIKPIPLTQYWLDKFGFETDYNDIEKTKQSYLLIDSYGLIIKSYMSELDTTKLCLCVMEEYAEDTDELTVTIYYIHQLQNLYFALTGEELTIKE